MNYIHPGLVSISFYAIPICPSTRHMIVTRDAEDYIRSVHSACNYSLVRDCNPRAHCTSALRVVLAEGYVRIPAYQWRIQGGEPPLLSPLAVQRLVTHEHQASGKIAETFHIMVAGRSSWYSYICACLAALGKSLTIKL